MLIGRAPAEHSDANGQQPACSRHGTVRETVTACNTLSDHCHIPFAFMSASAPLRFDEHPSEQLVAVVNAGCPNGAAVFA